MRKLPQSEDMYLMAIRAVFWVFCIGVLIFAAMMSWPVVRLIAGILTPFILGLIFAYILHPIVHFVETRLKLPRVTGIIVVAMMMLLGLVGFGAVVYPILYEQVATGARALSQSASKVEKEQILEILPDEYRDTFDSMLFEEEDTMAGVIPDILVPEEAEMPEDAAHMEPPLDEKVDEKGVVVVVEEGEEADSKTKMTEPDEDEDEGDDEGDGDGDDDGEDEKANLITRVLGMFSQEEKEEDDGNIGKLYGGAISTIRIISGFLGGIGAFLGTLSLTIVVTFYFLVEISKIPPVIRRVIPGDPSRRERIWDSLVRANDAIGGFLRGQLIAALGVGILTTLLLLTIGPRKYAVLIGFIAGAANFIPYLGPALGATPTILWGLTSPLFQSWVPELFGLDGWAARSVYIGTVILGFAAIQSIDGFIFQPMVVGKRASLHPLLVILSLVVGAQFGIAGMIVAVPAACFVKVMFVEFYWKDTRDFLEDTVYRQLKMPIAPSIPEEGMESDDTQLPRTLSGGPPDPKAVEEEGEEKKEEPPDEEKKEQ